RSSRSRRRRSKSTRFSQSTAIRPNVLPTVTLLRNEANLPRALTSSGRRDMFAGHDAREGAVLITAGLDIIDRHFAAENAHDIQLRSVSRFQCADHVVDESIATGHVMGEFAGVAGGGAPVSFRLLHIFDLRDGLIERENAWFDSAAVRRQVEAFHHR